MVDSHHLDVGHLEVSAGFDSPGISHIDRQANGILVVPVVRLSFAGP